MNKDLALRFEYFKEWQHCKRVAPNGLGAALYYGLYMVYRKIALGF